MVDTPPYDRRTWSEAREIVRGRRHRIYCPAALPRMIRGADGPNGEGVVTEQEIQQQVIEIVAEQMGVDAGEITRETSFVNDLNADSLDTVELVMEFEDRFETSIPDDKAEQIKTVGEAIDFIIEAKNAAKA